MVFKPSIVLLICIWLGLLRGFESASSDDLAYSSCNDGQCMCSSEDYLCIDQQRTERQFYREMRRMDGNEQRQYLQNIFLRAQAEGQIIEALVSLRILAEQAPNDISIRYNYGIILLDLGDVNKV